MSGVFPPECVSCERLVFWVQHMARGLWPHSCFSVWRRADWLGPVPLQEEVGVAKACSSRDGLRV